MTHATMALVVGPLEFQRPVWLWLIPILGALCVLMASKSLSGLGGFARWLALAVRLIVITLLAGALADPFSRRVAKDVAVTVIVDASESVPLPAQRRVGSYISQARLANPRPTDMLGVITTARQASVGALPSPHNRELNVVHQGAIDATNLASGVSMALATAPKNAATRVVLITDGNQTAGDVLAAAQSAKALEIPIDVFPVEFAYDSEVLVDRVIVPPSAREGETLNVKVVLQASKAARGRVNMLIDGQPVDLDAGGPGMGMNVQLREGQNVLSVPVTALKSGPMKFEAAFEPEMVGGVPVGDALPQNNKGSSVSFVAGEGKILLLANAKEELDPLAKVFAQANIRAEVRTHADAPASLTEMAGYEAIVLLNASAFDYSQKQQEDLRQYVHDTGGGLIMIGGPESFGAGGWIGSPLEEALPVRLDPPQKRQMPRGALVLCIHSVEIPEGVFYGKKVCEAAVNRLSRLDLVGINEYTGFGGTTWTYPQGGNDVLAPVGDGSAVKRAIQNLRFGDMPDFTPSFQASLRALKAAQAGQKHMIVISDGDPSPPLRSVIKEFKENGITVTTVGVATHSGADKNSMKWIAEETGGRFYDVDALGGVAKLPEIFMKEAMIVRRALLWESTQGVTPTLYAGASEALRGISRLPKVNGYVVTAEREGLALVTARVLTNKDFPQGDPLIAQWQYGLGRVVAFTSDATTRWNNEWVSWQGFQQFWEQHTRWVLRPQGSGSVRVTKEDRGDDTLLTVEAYDTKGERLNFAVFKGRLARPDGSSVEIELKQVAPGRYQTLVPTEQSGDNLVSLRYAAPDESVKGGTIEGSVQVAVSRPFADEYRVLRDNKALLTQVAEMTGGKVLSGDPQRDDLWRRDGVNYPVALTSIWLSLAIAGLALFLVDVGVRRVRIDPAAIAAWVRGGLGRSRAVQGQQLGSLRSAREQARERIKQRVERSGGSISPARLEHEARADVEAAKDRAKVKFEATPEQLRRAANQGVVMGGADAQPRKIQAPVRPTDEPGKKPGEEEGMSRLLKAKKKAQDEMRDE